jgi:hypothetical protein
MSDDAHSEWLPPQAPGAEPPRRWESLPDVPEAPFAAPAPAPQPAAPAPGPPADLWRGDVPPAPPGPGGYGASAVIARPAGNGAAVASLILGIAGLVLFFASGFGLFFILNLPCSILAWIFGAQAKRKLDRGQTNERRGMAQAGLALGVVGTVIGGLAIIGWAIGFLASEELRDEFRRAWDEQQAKQ